MRLKIYLFRHGQTFYNRDHRFTGWKDSMLTPRGIQDAKTIGGKLSGKKIDYAIQTHLSRSKDTLKHVLKYHPECKGIITDDRMIERSYGRLQGRTHDSLVREKGAEWYKLLRQWHKVDHLAGKERKDFVKEVGEVELQDIRRSYSTRPPGGESVQDVEKRVNSFIKDLLAFMKREKANVAISAHGNSMRPFRRHFEKLSIENMMKLENPWDDYFEYTIEL